MQKKGVCLWGLLLTTRIWANCAFQCWLRSWVGWWHSGLPSWLWSHTCFYLSPAPWGRVSSFLFYLLGSYRICVCVGRCFSSLFCEVLFLASRYSSSSSSNVSFKCAPRILESSSLASLSLSLPLPLQVGRGDVVEKCHSVFSSAILTHVGNNKQQCNEMILGTARPLRKCAIRERAGVVYRRFTSPTPVCIQGNDEGLYGPSN